MNEPQDVMTGTVLPAPPLDPHALADLLRQRQSWASVPASIPAGVTLALWLLLSCDAAVTVWLVGVQRGSLGCAGWPCDLATLAGHPRFTLCLAVASLASLLVIACVTKAFTAATAPVLVALGVSALVATAAVIGSVLLVVLGLAVLVVATLALLLLVAR